LSNFYSIFICFFCLIGSNTSLFLLRNKLNWCFYKF